MSADLKKEGITKEILNKIDLDRDFSPVQLMPNEEPVQLVKCSTGFWIMPEFGKYLRDEKNNLIVIPNKEAKIGRARYYLNFQEKIQQDKIDEEIKLLKLEVDEKLKGMLPRMSEYLQYAGLLPFDDMLEALVVPIQKSKGTYDSLVAVAKAKVNESTLSLYNRIKELYEQEDYDSLYILLFQDGLPQIASFSVNNQQDMDALIKSFHADTIDKTISQIKSQNHLYNIAKFNVEKRNENILNP